jgi:hypothetical protein
MHESISSQELVERRGNALPEGAAVSSTYFRLVRHEKFHERSNPVFFVVVVFFMFLVFL